MICMDCKYMKREKGDDELYICTNRNSKYFMKYAMLCCPDGCENGEQLTLNGFEELLELMRGNVR